jgi:glycerol kinase
MREYVLAVDQSTQGTKGLLFNKKGQLVSRYDVPHRQIIVNSNWVEHSPEEIYKNTLTAVQLVVEKAGIDKNDIACAGISNQRETAMVWDRTTGKPPYNAIVWQCSRAEKICEEIIANGYSSLIKDRTGLPLSPYFSAAKIKWILDNIEEATKLLKEKNLCIGTMDSWLVYKLTAGEYHKTDYSNASRTQFFNIFEQKWDNKICEIFGINETCLPEVCDSNSLFGYTDLEGYLERKIPIHAVLGDSHGALFGQGCLNSGMAKATYGTGSSVMMNTGESPYISTNGLVTSIGWKMNGIINYVLEGNINYTGAVIRWLKEDLQLIQSAKETETLAASADKNDTTYLVPAFSGLGAPYWNSRAKAVLCGMTRSTGKAEIVKAAEECIAYQITDIVNAMNEDAAITINELRVDGGPTRDKYLMQFQSDILNTDVSIPDTEELSGMGAAFAAGIATGVYDEKEIFNSVERKVFRPSMKEDKRRDLYNGWKTAVSMVNK